MRYSVISFDLDGTLVDTAGEIAEAANRTLADFGVPAQDLALITGFIGHGARHMMLQLRAEVLRREPGREGQLPTEPLLARLDQHYGATAGLMARPYPGCRETLKALRDGGVRVACLTNKELRYAHQVLDACGLSAELDCVVGGDSLPQRKPDPATFRHLLTLLGGELQRSAHVGDSATDVQTARAAGTQAWAVPWGYNGGEPVARCQPDRLFNSLPEIAHHVLQANQA